MDHQGLNLPEVARVLQVTGPQGCTVGEALSSRKNKQTKKNNQSVSQSIYHTHKLTMIFFSVFYVVYGDPINTARF